MRPQDTVSWCQGLPALHCRSWISTSLSRVSLRPPTSANLLACQATPASAVFLQLSLLLRGHRGSSEQAGRTSARPERRVCRLASLFGLMPLRVSFICHKFSVVLQRGQWLSPLPRRECSSWTPTGGGKVKGLPSTHIVLASSL